MLVKFSTVVPVSRAVAWAFAANFENIGAWDPGVKSSKKVCANNGGGGGGGGNVAHARKGLAGARLLTRTRLFVLRSCPPAPQAWGLSMSWSPSSRAARAP
jgi:hypothetical protein